LFVFYSAAGEVVVAVWYEKSFTVDRFSSRPSTYCIHWCSTVVRCQQASVCCAYCFWPCTFIYILRSFTAQSCIFKNRPLSFSRPDVKVALVFYIYIFIHRIGSIQRENRKETHRKILN